MNYMGLNVGSQSYVENSDVIKPVNILLSFQSCSMIGLRLALVVVASEFFTIAAHATCVCQCVEGRLLPRCTSSSDIPPVCPMSVCAMTPPSIAPPMQVPPVGGSQCSRRQVLKVVSRIFRTFIMRQLRFQVAAVDRVAAYSCSIWPTTLFRRCAVVALPPG